MQIVVQLKSDIFTGVYLPGEKIPSIRQLALKIGVNPNTIQHAFWEMKRRGLIYVAGTKGYFVTKDKEIIEAERHRLARKYTKAFLEFMLQLGFETSDIIDKYQRLLVKKRDE